MSEDPQELSAEEISSAFLRFTEELQKAMVQFENAFETQQKELAELKARVEKLEKAAEASTQ